MPSTAPSTLRGHGLDLVADIVGPADGVPILFLHGGGQTRQSWRKATEQAAAGGYRAISLDLRGHGDSDWAPDGQYSLDLFAADVRKVIEQIGDKPVLVGASLGGLTGLLIATEPHPPLRALVLVDVVPRVERAGAKEIASFMSSAPDGFASLDDAAAAVSAYLPHRERPKDTSGLLRNLRLRNGRYHWHWDPAFMRMGHANDLDAALDDNFDALHPLEAAAKNVTIPLMLIRGGRSRVVSDAGARAFQETVPHAELVDIPDADHMVAGDANDAFNAAVFRFVDAHVGAEERTRR